MIAPSGLYIQSYYKGYYKAYLNEYLSWNDAWVKCYQRRGRLAVIDNTNPYDKQAIVTKIKKYLVDYRRKWYNLWIGLKRSNDRWKDNNLISNAIYSINYVEQDLLIFALQTTVIVTGIGETLEEPRM